MTNLFNRCVKVVLRSEGGYVNHPLDPGGETNYGIAKKFFPSEDIKNLTVMRAISLYYIHYWKPMNLEGINSEPLVLQVFDHGINTGKVNAIKTLQRLVGAEPDGVCGPVTKGLVNVYFWDLLDAYMEARRKYYRNLVKRKPAMKIFLEGWLRRVDKTHF